MVKELTKEQESKIPEFIDKWVGIASQPMDKDVAFDAIDKLYERMGKDKPIKIVGYSPIQCVLMCAILKTIGGLDSQLDSQMSSQLYSQLYSLLSSQLDSQLDSQLRSQLSSHLFSKLGYLLSSQLDSQLSSQLGSKLSSHLFSQLDSELSSQLDSQLSSQLRSQLSSHLFSKLGYLLSSQLDSQLYSQLYSQLSKINNDWYLSYYWLTWCGWYDYGKYIGVDFDNELLDLFINFNSNVHFTIPYDGICFISEKPKQINWDNGKLHNDSGAAIEYEDGYSMYSLNGVAVPEYLAVTRSEDLKMDFFLEEKNAAVKAEFIRKYGIERMASMGKEVDTYENYNDEWWTNSQYKIIDMSPIFTHKSYCPYLYMKNQTVDGVFHMEGVHPDCKTLKDALEFRNNGFINLETISIK